MKNPTHHLLLAAVAGTLAAAPAVCPAALPAAWESFFTETNAEAWALLDGADDKFYPVQWFDPEGNPYIGEYHIGDFSLTFVAGPEVGEGAFTGDYHAANVAAVSCDIFIDDLDEFDFVECSVTADGPAGRRLYYSTPFYWDEFDGDGWWTVEFSFDDDWWYLEDDEWVAVEVDEEFLSDIGDLGIGFFPRSGTDVDSLAAIDNVVLEPRLTAPELATSAPGSSFRISFTPAPGLVAAVERLEPAPEYSWSEVVANITGPTAYHFTTPRNAPSKIFRVGVEPDYELVVTPGS